MKNFAITIKQGWRQGSQLSFLALGGIFSLFFSDSAYADPWSSGFGICAMADEFTGGAASAIATIAICTIGTAACLGRVQWSTAIMTAVGVSILFGTANFLGTC